MALLTQTQQDYYNGDDFGGYQFISLNTIISNFTIAYVGENKIIPKIRRTDIAFHAQRGMQELSFDTFKSVKAQEITLPPSNTMALPQDYVNYTKICWVDGNGIERPLYPTKHTSNPTPILQNKDGEYKLTAVGTTTSGSNEIVLNGEYKEIQVGMIADNLIYAPTSGTAIVQSVSHDNNITTITLGIVNTTLPFNSAFNTGDKFTFNFYKENESLLLEKTAIVLENITWTALDRVLTQSPNTDVSSVKAGMLVSHTAFPVGTVVVDVTDNNIFVSNTAVIASTSTTNEVTFVSTPNDSTTWDSYSSDTNNSTGDANGYNHDTDIYDLNIGQRYGVETSIAQGNGSYYIDNLKGLIHFSSNVSGKTVILKYISDGLGTDEEMVVHKFAEEAMYKYIACAIASTTVTGQALVPRLKKEKYAAIRQAKLRLSNIKLNELIQIMRGKSKWIKH
tara:strand:+ start:665 stop:2014 length:1350 start_codon:yes stop_codon:yes gene_type:complete